MVDEAKRERLAGALRANLRRRKASAPDPAADPSSAPPAEPPADRPR